MTSKWTTAAELAWRFAAAHVLLLPAAVGGIAYLLLSALRASRLRQEGNSPPPGGIGSWCRGAAGAETLSFLADNSSGRGFYHFVHARALRYGACFRTVLFGRTHVFLLSSRARAAAAHLLAADPPHFAKRYVRTVADLLGEHSLLCTSHDAHRRMCRAVAGLFASASTAAFAAAFDHLTVSDQELNLAGTKHLRNSRNGSLKLKERELETQIAQACTCWLRLLFCKQQLRVCMSSIH